MQKITISVLVGLILGGAAVYLFMQQSPSQPAVSAEPTSYQAVTGHLDEGGELYAYLSTDRLIDRMETLVKKMRTLAVEQAAPSPDRDARVGETFDFVYGLIEQSGLMDIDGIGISSIRIEDGLNHSRFVIHHEPEKSDGLIWQLMEPGPKELSDLDWLPRDTVFSISTSFRPGVLWRWIRKNAEASPVEKVRSAVMAVEPMLKSQDIDLQRVLDSFAGRFTFFITLDQQKTHAIPLGDRMKIDLPEPGIAFWFTVKGDTVFDLIREKLPFAKPVPDRDKTLLIPVPKAPFPFEPVIQQKGNMLIVASHQQVVNRMVSASEKGDGIRTDDEFKRLSLRMPAAGNDTRFLSKRFFETIFKIQEHINRSLGHVDTSGESAWQEIQDMFPGGIAMFSVLQYTSRGCVLVANHTVGLEELVLVPVSAAAGMASVGMRQRSTAIQDRVNQNRTLESMRRIALAIEMYRTDEGKLPEGNSLEEIRALLEPDYTDTLPMEDGWGFAFYYRADPEDKGYTIASPGKDGRFEGFDQRGKYTIDYPEDFNRDILLADGQFVYSPEAK